MTTNDIVSSLPVDRLFVQTKWRPDEQLLNRNQKPSSPKNQALKLNNKGTAQDIQSPFGEVYHLQEETRKANQMTENSNQNFDSYELGDSQKKQGKNKAAGWDNVRKNREETLQKKVKSPSLIESYVKNLRTAMMINIKGTQTLKAVEIYDECGVYLQRTLQLLWLIVRLDLMNQEIETSDQFRKQMLQLSHRVKLCSLIILQLAPKDRVTSFLDSLTQYQLLEYKLAISSVLPKSSQQLSLDIPPITELLLMSGITYKEYVQDDDNNIRELKQQKTLYLLRESVENIINDNPIWKNSQMSSRHQITEAIEKCFMGSKSVSTELLVEALQGILQQNSKADLSNLTSVYQEVLGQSATISTPLAKEPAKEIQKDELRLQTIQQDRASYLGLDNFFGYDLDLCPDPYSVTDESNTHQTEQARQTFGHNTLVTDNSIKNIQEQSGPNDSGRQNRIASLPTTSKSIFLQDFIFFSDFISVAELVNLIQNASYSIEKLESHISKLMEANNSNVIQEHLLRPKKTPVVLPQKSQSLRFALVLLSMFGLKDLQLNQPGNFGQSPVSKAQVLATISDSSFFEQLVQSCEMLFDDQQVHIILDPDFNVQLKARRPSVLTKTEKQFQDQQYSSLELQNLLAQSYLFLKWQLVEAVEIDEREGRYQMNQQKLSVRIGDLEDTAKKIKVKVTDANIAELQKALAIYNPSEAALRNSQDKKQEQKQEHESIAAKNSTAIVLSFIQSYQDILKQIREAKIEKFNKRFIELHTQRLEDKPVVQTEEKKKGPKDKPVDEQALNQARLQHFNNVVRGENVLGAASMRLQFQSSAHQKLADCHLQTKKRILLALFRVELLLNQIDQQMYKERHNICILLSYTGDGIVNKESSIKEQLRDISLKEMEKGKDEDALQEQTLKTLEVINIADIKIEKQNLEKQTNALYAKQMELYKQEDNLVREQKRREKKAKADKASKRPKQTEPSNQN